MTDTPSISRIAGHTSGCTCPFCLMAQQNATVMQNLAVYDAATPSAWSSDAAAGNGKKVLTIAQAAAQIDRYGVSWATNTKTTTIITYSFYTANPGSSLFSTESAGFSAFSSAQKKAAIEALGEWAATCNVQFVQVSDPSKADIKFANTTSGPAQAWTYGPDSSQQGGTVWINPAQSSNGQLNYGQYGLLTLVHEIGHALGLAHPGDYDFSTGMPTYQANALYYQDSWQYTVMSYFSETNTGANYNGTYASTPLLTDIAAVQALYGAATNVRNGNTTYGFHSTAGDPVYDFTVNTAPVVCITDTGGYNTLDLSGFNTADTINLQQGGFSSTAGMVNNISIAYGTQVDCAIAGNGADTLVANNDGDRLVGGNGADKFYAGSGNDTLVGGYGTNTYYFAATFGQDTVQQNLSGLATLKFNISAGSLNFARSANDLVIAETGTSDSVDIQNYYSKTSSFTLMDGNGITFMPTAVVTLSASPVVSTPVVTAMTSSLSITNTIPFASNTVIGSGINFLGQNELDLISRVASGPIIVWGFNGSGNVMANQYLYHGSDAVPFSAGTTVIGAGVNYIGQGESDIITRDANGTIIDWGFSSTGQWMGSQFLLHGTSFIPFGSSTVVMGSTVNYLGQGERDMITRDVNGTITDWGINSTGQWIGGQFLLHGNSAVPFASNSTIIGTAVNFYGQGERDVITRDPTSGAVIGWGFNSAGQWIGGQFLVQANGSTLSVDSTQTVIGASHNVINAGSNDLFFRTSAGQFVLNEFNSSGHLIYNNTLTTVASNSLGTVNGSTIQNYNGQVDVIDITDLAYDSTVTAQSTLNAGGATGTITVSDHGAVVGSINLQSIISLGGVTTMSDGARGTLIVDPPTAKNANNTTPVTLRDATGLGFSGAAGTTLITAGSLTNASHTLVLQTKA